MISDTEKLINCLDLDQTHTQLPGVLAQDRCSGSYQHVLECIYRVERVLSLSIVLAINCNFSHDRFLILFCPNALKAVKQEQSPD